MQCNAGWVLTRMMICLRREYDIERRMLAYQVRYTGKRGTSYNIKCDILLFVFLFCEDGHPTRTFNELFFSRFSAKAR